MRKAIAPLTAPGQSCGDIEASLRTAGERRVKHHTWCRRLRPNARWRTTRGRRGRRISPLARISYETDTHVVQSIHRFARRATQPTRYRVLDWQQRITRAYRHQGLVACSARKCAPPTSDRVVVHAVTCLFFFQIVIFQTGICRALLSPMWWSCAISPQDVCESLVSPYGRSGGCCRPLNSALGPDSPKMRSNAR